VSELTGAADGDGKRTTGAIRSGVGVIASDQHTGLSKAQFRRDDMRDALIAMMHAYVRQREVGCILVEHFDNTSNFGIRD
jgi:hypothetical protein